MNATITLTLSVPPELDPDAAGEWLAAVLAAARGATAELEGPADDEPDEPADEVLPIAERPVTVPGDVAALLKRWGRYIARNDSLPGWLIDQLRLMVGELIAGGVELVPSRNSANSYLRMVTPRGTVGYIRSTSVSWTHSQLAYREALGEDDWPRLELTRHPRDAAAIVLAAVHAYDPEGTDLAA